MVIPMRGVVSTRCGRNPSSATHKPEVTLDRSFPLSRSRVMPKASANRPGPLVSFRRSRSVVQGDFPQSAHRFDSGKRLERAKQNASRFSIGKARHVEAVVISVDEVNIGVAGRPEQHGVPRGAACGGVSGVVLCSQVGFDFDDPSG